jgi:hypothetical protein
MKDWKTFHRDCKSAIVENGKTLINCLAYIGLNPVRANIVENRKTIAGIHSAACRPKRLNHREGKTGVGD